LLQPRGERRIARQHGDAIRHRRGIARGHRNDRGSGQRKRWDPFQLLEDQLDALLTQRIGR